MPTTVARIQRTGRSRPRLASHWPTPMIGACDQARDQSGQRVVDAAGDQASRDTGDRKRYEAGGPDQPRNECVPAGRRGIP